MTELIAFMAGLEFGWLNSAFVTSLLGALAGAYAGARGAQKIAERSKARDQALAELRSTNSAIMVCFSVFTATVQLKSQHVLPTLSNLRDAKRELEAHIIACAVGARQGNAPVRLSVDFKTFPPPVVPISVLKDLLFHRTSSAGRPLALVSILEQSLVGVERTIARRDELIATYKDDRLPPEGRHHYFLGHPQPNGDANQEYPDVIEAMASYVDDVLFFSWQLCKDLISHGDQVRAASRKLLGDAAPKVSRIDISTPLKHGLVPPEENYQQWLNSFPAASGAATPGG